MDAYDRCTNLGKKILPIVLPSMVEAEKFSDHPNVFQKNGDSAIDQGHGLLIHLI